MKRVCLFAISILSLAMVLVGANADIAYSQVRSPRITLTPTSGFAATTVVGDGFSVNGFRFVLSFNQGVAGSRPAQHNKVRRLSPLESF